MHRAVHTRRDSSESSLVSTSCCGAANLVTFTASYYRAGAHVEMGETFRYERAMIACQWY